jgi:hypothetical protein
VALPTWIELALTPSENRRPEVFRHTIGYYRLARQSARRCLTIRDVGGRPLTNTSVIPPRITTSRRGFPTAANIEIGRRREEVSGASQPKA